MNNTLGEAVLGIDIGKTKVCLAIVTPQGKILKIHRFPTYTGMNTKLFTNELYEEVSKLNANIRTLRGIGVGVRGLVSHKKNQLISSTLFGTALNDDIRQMISDHYELPTFIDNDVKAATVAEALFGEGKGKEDFVFVNVGTGIGMGAYANGKLIRGNNNFAGEISDYVTDIFVRSMECETLEDYISGEALSHKGVMIPSVDHKEGNVPIELSSDHCCSSKLMSVDESGTLAINRFVTGLTTFLHNVECILDPQIIVLGGGVMSNKLLTGLIFEHRAQQTQSFRKERRTPIVITKLGADNIGVLGAASLVLAPQQIWKEENLWKNMK